MYVSLKIVPVRGEIAGQFTAPNPWNGNSAEHWTVNVYDLVSETFATTVKWAHMRKQPTHTVDPASRLALQNRKPKMRQTIGFESADGRQHMLPRVLDDLWRSGEVPDQTLPALLKQFEPKLKRTDFKMSRRRLIFKVEAIMCLMMGIACLTLWLINRVGVNSAHRQAKPDQAVWLTHPMSEQSIWVNGDGVKLDAYVRLRSGAVQPPPGLRTYGTLSLLGWFKAENETRLALMDDSESQLRSSVPDSKLILRGVVLSASKLGVTPRMLDSLAQKIPNLNKEFVFVYNVDWPDEDGALHIGEEGALVFGWFGLCLQLPFAAFMLASRFWRRRDGRLKEEFRNAILHLGSRPALLHSAGIGAGFAV
jgi:hypothetical protein